ncbi:hypothetical protein EPHNCH_1483 [Anaplasma phagocytophilum str. NCH-1]|uniref:Uncharacterized protein n=1 Tax=Anaplasma phagocytophilum str. NCH-1 TaxID=1359161 RepID=A0A0F3MUI5_ANAPH|nr:hypothetical protein EPHNCH_1483 [Anaplasma phagocytophilum str. NCH-1]KJV86831.1 hypothetical protein APHNYW_1187 [Anaplasma phagocytophilum str. ApNYW]
MTGAALTETAGNIKNIKKIILITQLRNIFVNISETFLKNLFTYLYIIIYFAHLINYVSYIFNYKVPVPHRMRASLSENMEKIRLLPMSGFIIN